MARAVERWPCQTTRRRRLSSITCAPCRKVMGVPGQRSHAAVGSECNLIVLDAGDVLHDAFAVRRPCIDAESKVSPECGHLRFLPSSVSRGPRFGLPRCVGQALATEAIAE